MGQQVGLIQLKGRVGNVSFYKTKDGFGARTASGVDGEKIRNHPRYQRTRENMAEFQQAMKAVKLFRKAFADDIKFIADGGLTTRLMSFMSKLVRQDAVNVRGARVVQPVTTGALQGFELNKEASLSSAMKIPFTSVFDRSTGSFSVELPAFVPKELVIAPEGATHLVLRTTTAEIDFAGEQVVSRSAQSPPIPVGALAQDALSLAVSLPGSTKPLFLALGISYVQIINGISYALQSSKFAAMQVVKVDTGMVV